MNRIARLDSRALVRVTGPDARPFLHNLLTQDVETLGEGKTDEFSFSATVIQDEDSPQGFHDVAGVRTTKCFREPSGRYFVSLRAMGESTNQDITAGISFKLERVDFIEGVR